MWQTCCTAADSTGVTNNIKSGYMSFRFARASVSCITAPGQISGKAKWNQALSNVICSSLPERSYALNKVYNTPCNLVINKKKTDITSLQSAALLDNSRAAFPHGVTPSSTQRLLPAG